MVLALAQPLVVGSRPVRRPRLVAGSRLKTVVRVGSFDESAAQVRRLVDRDRKELDYDALEDNFKSDPPKEEGAQPSNRAENNMTAFAVDKADKTPVSPFGPSSSAPAASPFSAPGSSGLNSGGMSFARKPFAEPSGLRPDMPPDNIKQDPWYTQITLAQIVIALSFTTIIGLMIATFFVVVSMGGVRFNE